MLVEKASYLLVLSRYIVANPVRAGIVNHAGDWKWSSYNVTIKNEKGTDFVATGFILVQFSDKEDEAIRKYEEFVGEGTGDKSIYEETVGQILLGGEKFIEQLKGMLWDKKAIREIPQLQRYADRPSLERILSREASDKKERDGKIIEAHIKYRYKLREIINAKGIH